MQDGWAIGRRGKWIFNSSQLWGYILPIWIKASYCLICNIYDWYMYVGKLCNWRNICQILNQIQRGASTRATDWLEIVGARLREATACSATAAIKQVSWLVRDFKFNSERKRGREREREREEGRKEGRRKAGKQATAAAAATAGFPQGVFKEVMEPLLEGLMIRNAPWNVTKSLMHAQLQYLNTPLNPHYPHYL